jgi:hypothetical protein
MAPPQSGSPVGLINLFTTLSSGLININTASPEVLQLMPGIDSTLAQSIITTRSGLDGMDGTEDDSPFRSPGELINVPGMLPGVVQQNQGAFTTRSFFYEVLVDARVGLYHRQFVGVLRRNQGNPRDVQTLFFHWR